MVTERDDLDMGGGKVEGPPKSKTQELRDWLDGEIKRASSDIKFLSSALQISKYVLLRDANDRYGGLTSSEFEVKTTEDRKTLEELQKRLELLRSAKELDIDIDAMEKNGLIIMVDKDTIKCYFQTYFAADEPTFLFDFSVTEKTVRAYNSGESPISFSLVYRNVKKIRVQRENGYLAIGFNPDERDQYLVMTAYLSGYSIFSLNNRQVHF